MKRFRKCLLKLRGIDFCFYRKKKKKKTMYNLSRSENYLIEAPAYQLF